MSEAFRPWVKPLVWGLVLCAGGCLVMAGSVRLGAVYGQAAALGGAAAGAALLLAGAALLKSAEVRQKGQEAERRAAQQLTRLLKRTDWDVQANESVAGLGDADIVLRSRDGAPTGRRTIVVEVKSVAGVKVETKLFSGGKARLRPVSGGSFQKDPIAQVQALATRLEAEAVVWFPMAQEKSVKVLKKDQVTVIQGSAELLVRELGLKKPLFGVRLW